MGLRKRRRTRGPECLPSNLIDLECGSKSQRAAARRVAQQHYAITLPSVLREKELRAPNYDKFFACEWQDSDNIVLGTKCNALLNLHLPTGKLTDIPRPPRPERDFSTDNPSWGSCGIHCIGSNLARDLLATGGADPADCVVLRTSDWAPVATLVGHRDWVFGVAWLTDRHLVTGSRDGAVALWGVGAAAEAAAAGAAAGVPAPPAVQRYDYHNAAHMRRIFDDKVRDVRYDADLGLLGALGSTGVVKLLDPGRDLDTAHALKLGGSNLGELVSMAMTREVVAVGARSCVKLLDPRRPFDIASVATFLSPDNDNGVRSVCINNRMLSFATGQGKLCFYDMRAGRYLRTWERPLPGQAPRDTDAAAPAGGSISDSPAAFRLPENDAPPPWRPPPPAWSPAYFPAPATIPAPQDYFLLGGGWMRRDETYYELLALRDLQEIRQACYAHAWDPSGTRLFACGGPLAFGLRGGYLSLWE